MSVSPVRVGPGSALMNRDATALWRPLFTLPDSLFIKMQVKSVKVKSRERNEEEFQRRDTSMKQRVIFKEA